MAFQIILVQYQYSIEILNYFSVSLSVFQKNPKAQNLSISFFSKDIPSRNAYISTFFMSIVKFHTRNTKLNSLKSYPKYKVNIFVKGITNILFNNVNNLAFLVRNLTIDMKKVGSYALPERISL